MESKDIIKKIKNFRCVIHKIDYELDIEKVQEKISHPLTISVAHRTEINILIADYAIRLFPKLKIEDKQFGRYKIILEFFIDIMFDELVREFFEKKLIKEKDKYLMFELLKLSTSKINEVTRKIFEWMDFKGEVTTEQLIHTFKEISEKIKKAEVTH